VDYTVEPVIDPLLAVGGHDLLEAKHCKFSKLHQFMKSRSTRAPSFGVIMAGKVRLFFLRNAAFDFK
jgi:hypothetical protein